MAKTTKLDMLSVVIMQRAGMLRGVNTCGTPAIDNLWHSTRRAAWHCRPGLPQHQRIPSCHFASMCCSGHQSRVPLPATGHGTSGRL